LAFVVVTAAIFLLLFGSSLLASPDAIVRIEPAQSEVTVGESFTISVMIEDASDLGGFEFDVLVCRACPTA